MQGHELPVLLPLDTWVNKDHYILVLNQLRIHMIRKHPELVGYWIRQQHKVHPHMARLGLSHEMSVKHEREIERQRSVYQMCVEELVWQWVG